MLVGVNFENSAKFKENYVELRKVWFAYFIIWREAASE